MNNSMDSVSIENVKPKFFIKYEQQQPIQRIKRYSSKAQNENIKKYQKSEEVKIEKKNHIKNLPSYQQPTENFITSKIQKARPASIAQLKQQNASSVLSTQRSKSLQREREPENDKQYSKIPIEYYDERDHGSGADGLRGRVIFRGYAPKNTYFFLKTLKPIELLKKNPIANMRNDFEIRFNSKFESGNLSAVNRISQNQFWLFMREDTNTHGLRQWFYFQANNRKSMKVKFRIYKFTKYHSLYRIGMKPYIRNYKQENTWKQAGEKIIYDYDSLQKSFYLEFQYKFQEDNQSIEFATLPPYTYTMLKQYLQGLKQNPNVSIDTAGQSLSGIQIPLVILSNHDKKSKKAKQAIFIMARTHPGETVSNFSLQSMIQKILSLPELLTFYDFFIIPMVNPDGVYFGNHRTGALGQDINRNFHNNDTEYFPEVEAVQNTITKVKNSYQIRFLIDLHGHSARKNIFAYGDEHQIHTKSFLLTRILPKLLNDAISSFKYDYCVFRGSKQKKHTARVFFANKFKLITLTFEQSYGLLDTGNIGLINWRNFGVTLAESLLDFAKIYEKGQQKQLQFYLKDETIKQKEYIEKRIQRHKKMLGIESAPDLKKSGKVQIGKKMNLKEKFLTKKTEKDLQPSQNLQIDIKKINTEVEVQAQVENENKQEDNLSVNSSELSSGDDDLQLLNDELEVIKKQIVKVGCLKQGFKREIYNVADKRIQLNSWQFHDEYRMHQQKSSMIPRILKLQMQRKQQYKQSIKRDMYDKSYLRKDRLAFPQIRK